MKNKIAAVLHRLGLSPDFLTLLGLVLAGVSGWLIYEGRFFAAGLVLLASGLVDLMDGAVARVSGKASVFGGILDSSLDRYGDGFVFGGLVFHFLAAGRPVPAAFALSAGIGAFAVSYVRARAECEIDSCRVGFWERGERIGVLVVGLLAGHAALASILLGIAVHWTVLQRLLLSFYETRPGAKAGAHPFFLRPSRRDEPSYFAKLAFLAALLVWA